MTRIHTLLASRFVKIESHTDELGMKGDFLY